MNQVKILNVGETITIEFWDAIPADYHTLTMTLSPPVPEVDAEDLPPRTKNDYKKKRYFNEK